MYRGLSRILNAPLSHEAGCSILNEAFHKGITFFDTTDAYGQKHDNKIMIGKTMAWILDEYSKFHGYPPAVVTGKPISI
ncbi:unnamed protein product [Camellia sinensis]